MLSLCLLRPPRLRCFARTALVVLLGLRHAASPAALPESWRRLGGGGEPVAGEEEEWEVGKRRRVGEVWVVKR